ncbi:Flagellar FliL protein [Candidatus Arcanobacter lacustris]|uniref:Flagellar protein FliL n=1 Tax=Candidatus Arcanibacter lacustris TaxID=1607817 RepID=A0A0F5MPD2_9RICK|nr:Flagellar FliL protein [Candidatus Arcanobacter lacustris]
MSTELEEKEEQEQNPETEVKQDTSKKAMILAKLKGKKKILLIIIPVVLILIAGIVFFIMKHKSAAKPADTTIEKHDGAAATQAKQVTTYLDMDEFIVNLDKGDNQPNFLKMSVTLQLPGQDAVAAIKDKMPVIRDAFQVYLRELRGDDLNGSAGMFRLREELLFRVNYIVTPNKVDDILFREILVQ